MRVGQLADSLAAQEHWPNVAENNPVEALAVSFGKAENAIAAAMGSAFVFRKREAEGVHNHFKPGVDGFVFDQCRSPVFACRWRVVVDCARSTCDIVIDLLSEALRRQWTACRGRRLSGSNRYGGEKPEHIVKH